MAERADSTTAHRSEPSDESAARDELPDRRLADYLQAERLVVEALRDLFDREPAAWIAEQLEALSQLRALYEPRRLDLPAEKARIEAEIAEIERRREADAARAAAPPPSS